MVMQCDGDRARLIGCGHPFHSNGLIGIVPGYNDIGDAFILGFGVDVGDIEIVHPIQTTMELHVDGFSDLYLSLLE